MKSGEQITVFLYQLYLITFMPAAKANFTDKNVRLYKVKPMSRTHIHFLVVFIANADGNWLVMADVYICVRIFISVKKDVIYFFPASFFYFFKFWIPKYYFSTSLFSFLTQKPYEPCILLCFWSYDCVPKTNYWNKEVNLRYKMQKSGRIIHLR